MNRHAKARRTSTEYKKYDWLVKHGVCIPVDAPQAGFFFFFFFSWLVSYAKTQSLLFYKVLLIIFPTTKE